MPILLLLIRRNPTRVQEDNPHLLKPFSEGLVEAVSRGLAPALFDRYHPPMFCGVQARVCLSSLLA